MSSLERKPKGDSLRFVLRSGTRAEHDELDHHPSFTALMDGTLDLDGYSEIMLALHDLYRSLDGPVLEACRRHGVARHGFVYHPRTAMLAGDVASLRIAHPRPESEDTIEENRSIGSLEALCGTLYVIEGSVLGGSMMCRATETVLRRSGAAGNGYWQWCRDIGAVRWAMTCDLLDAVSAAGASTDAMVEAARSAFREITERLEPCKAVLLQGSHTRCQVARSI